MARVTVEDCVDKVPNRFELVLIAAHRARAITNGSAITVTARGDATIAGSTIVLTGTFSNGQVMWTCGGTILAKYRPDSCQN